MSLSPLCVSDDDFEFVSSPSVSSLSSASSFYAVTQHDFGTASREQSPLHEIIMSASSSCVSSRSPSPLSLALPPSKLSWSQRVRAQPASHCYAAQSCDKLVDECKQTQSITHLSIDCTDPIGTITTDNDDYDDESPISPMSPSSIWAMAQRYERRLQGMKQRVKSEVVCTLPLSFQMKDHGCKPRKEKKKLVRVESPLPPQPEVRYKRYVLPWLTKHAFKSQDVLAGVKKIQRTFDHFKLKQEVHNKFHCHTKPPPQPQPHPHPVSPPSCDKPSPLIVTPASPTHAPCTSPVTQSLCDNTVPCITKRNKRVKRTLLYHAYTPYKPSLPQVTEDECDAASYFTDAAIEEAYEEECARDVLSYCDDIPAVATYEPSPAKQRHVSTRNYSRRIMKQRTIIFNRNLKQSPPQVSQWDIEKEFIASHPSSSTSNTTNTSSTSNTAQDKKQRRKHLLSLRRTSNRKIHGAKRSQFRFAQHSETRVSAPATSQQLYVHLRKDILANVNQINNKQQVDSFFSLSHPSFPAAHLSDASKVAFIYMRPADASSRLTHRTIEAALRKRWQSWGFMSQIRQRSAGHSRRVYPKKFMYGLLPGKTLKAEVNNNEWYVWDAFNRWRPETTASFLVCHLAPPASASIANPNKREIRDMTVYENKDDYWVSNKQHLTPFAVIQLSQREHLEREKMREFKWQKTPHVDKKQLRRDRQFVQQHVAQASQHRKNHKTLTRNIAAYRELDTRHYLLDRQELNNAYWENLYDCYSCCCTPYDLSDCEDEQSNDSELSPANHSSNVESFFLDDGHSDWLAQQTEREYSDDDVDHYYYHSEDYDDDDEHDRFNDDLDDYDQVALKVRHSSLQAIHGSKNYFMIRHIKDLRRERRIEESYRMRRRVLSSSTRLHELCRSVRPSRSWIEAPLIYQPYCETPAAISSSQCDARLIMSDAEEQEQLASIGITSSHSPSGSCQPSLQHTSLSYESFVGTFHSQHMNTIKQQLLDIAHVLDGRKNSPVRRQTYIDHSKLIQHIDIHSLKITPFHNTLSTIDRFMQTYRMLQQHNASTFTFPTFGFTLQTLSSSNDNTVLTVSPFMTSLLQRFPQPTHAHQVVIVHAVLNSNMYARAYDEPPQSASNPKRRSHARRGSKHVFDNGKRFMLSDESRQIPLFIFSFDYTLPRIIYPSYGCKGYCCNMQFARDAKRRLINHDRRVNREEGKFARVIEQAWPLAQPDEDLTMYDESEMYEDY